MRRLQRVAAALLVLLTAAVCSADSAPNTFVRRLEEQVKTVLRAKDVVLANSLFADHLDMPLFSKRCLIDHWDEFTPAERLQYQMLLERAIRRRMSEKTMFAPDDTSFRLTPKKVSPEEPGVVKVDNLLRAKGDDIQLGIFLVKQGSGYKVVDYEIEGALLSRNYRGQFNYLLRKHGKAGFFERLEAKAGD